MRNSADSHTGKLIFIIGLFKIPFLRLSYEVDRSLIESCRFVLTEKVTSKLNNRNIFVIVKSQEIK